MMEMKGKRKMKLRIGENDYLSEWKEIPCNVNNWSVEDENIGIVVSLRDIRPTKGKCSYEAVSLNGKRYESGSEAVEFVIAKCIGIFSQFDLYEIGGSGVPIFRYNNDSDEKARILAIDNERLHKENTYWKSREKDFAAIIKGAADDASTRKDISDSRMGWKSLAQKAVHSIGCPVDDCVECQQVFDAIREKRPDNFSHFGVQKVK